VPLPTVAKILNALTRDSLVASQRGASGGYTLSRPAEQRASARWNRSAPCAATGTRSTRRSAGRSAR
jgi:hypothetical protein